MLHRQLVRGHGRVLHRLRRCRTLQTQVLCPMLSPMLCRMLYPMLCT